MDWMSQWFKSMAEHNQGKCDKETCRHCQREKATRLRVNNALVKATAFAEQMREQGITKVVADYNGGYDEDFVDYVSYYTGENRICCCETYKEEDNWYKFTKQMYEIAYGVLGHGFGTGEFSVCGRIILDVKNKVLYNNDNEIGRIGS